MENSIETAKDLLAEFVRDTKHDLDSPQCQNPDEAHSLAYTHRGWLELCAAIETLVAASK